MKAIRALKQLTVVLVIVANMFLCSPAHAQAQFSDKPRFPLQTWQLSSDKDPQKFNGRFVRQLVDELPASALPCLQKLADQNHFIGFKTFADGGIKSNLDLASCNLSRTADLQSETGFTDQGSIDANRLVALILAVGRFEREPIFATNDRNLATYDFSVVVTNDVAAVYLDPGPQKSTVAGCPKTGAINAAYYVNLRTYAVRIGRMVC